MNTVITNDITLAISRPLNRSLTRATETMRGPAAPIPCNRRPNNICSKLTAKIEIRHPSANRAKPEMIAGRRPIASDRGPKNIWPTAMPIKNTEITYWLSLIRVTPRSVAISGKAGNMVSIDKATSEIINAMRMMNSSDDGSLLLLFADFMFFAGYSSIAPQLQTHATGTIRAQRGKLTSTGKRRRNIRSGY